MVMEGMSMMADWDSEEFSDVSDAVDVGVISPGGFDRPRYDSITDHLVSILCWGFAE
jgi:hypothetical protein